MERDGPYDGLCRFRIHLGMGGDCPLSWPLSELKFFPVGAVSKKLVSSLLSRMPVE
uniref:Uncharacterized protein n=1 Tax=Oryza sativa subsp. japonica TaxID=39947 RepID=Q6ZB10_ORYSJ|nr:hypothetical protein [Oryza sativa Japonica Group]